MTYMLHTDPLFYRTQTRNNMTTLPRVEREVAETVRAEVLQDNEDFIMKNLQRLRKENPVIAEWIAGFSSGAGTHGEVAMAVIVAYRMLEEQQKALSN